MLRKAFDIVEEGLKYRGRRGNHFLDIDFSTDNRAVECICRMKRENKRATLQKFRIRSLSARNFCFSRQRTDAMGYMYVPLDDFMYVHKSCSKVCVLCVTHCLRSVETKLNK